ncbi:MAG: DUF389 domain-containing protein [Chloroflexi bacterium]|nr:DUF389 domain-containing protein [Chloroflexota bacterium]
MTENSAAEGARHDPLAQEEYYARTVVVPVGRHDTAAEMLNLAGEIVHPSEGLVIALVISLGDVEKTTKVSTALSRVIEDFGKSDRGHRVELVTEIAVSVSRGILDVARERGADVIILGVQRSTRRQVKLGTVVENVIATAPCGVLIYRSSSSPGFSRVVIPVDGSLAATAAIRLGRSIALQHEIPVLQTTVQHGYHYNPDHERLIHDYESRSPAEIGYSKIIIAGRDPGGEIVSRLTEDNLLVIGFSQKSDFERQITNDLSNQLLNQAPGPVILISQIEWHRGFRGVIEHGMARINPQLTLVEQNEIIWSAQKSAHSNLDFLVMIVLSAALATLGLLTNSAAVIIGAMLVAPLMSPLSSFSVGMATGILDLTRRGIVTLVQGVSLALLISIVMGVVLPIDTPTEEILARGSPNLLDAAIALVSGLVAAYATARKGIPAALAGVAIAAALMPPLCTIGIGIALRDVNLALGASLLFLANITFIIAAGYITFLWLGMHPGESREGAGLKQPRLWWIVLCFITVAVTGVFARLGSQAIDESHIRERLETEVFSGATVVEYHVISSVPLGVQLIVQSEKQIKTDEVESAHLLINELYGEDVDVKVIARQVVRPTTPVSAAVAAILTEILPTTRVVDVIVENEGGLMISATIQDVAPPASAELAEIKQRLGDLSDEVAEIEILFQQVIRLDEPSTDIPELPDPTTQQ